MPAVPGFVNENGAMGKRTTAAGAVLEFGCAGHDDQLWRRLRGNSHDSTGCRSDARTRGRQSY